MKNQIFISFSIDESLEMVKQIYNYLTLSKYVVSFDEKSVHTGEFDESIEKKVKECKDFVLILTPNLFNERQEKDWIQKEISLALKYRKNIVVVTVYNMDKFPDNVPKSIKEIKNCHIIKLNEVQNWEKIIFEALSSRPHFFLKRRGDEKNKDAVKRSNLILHRKRIIIFLFIISCSLIRYTYSDNWGIPVWTLRIFNALHELVLYQFILIMISPIVAVRLYEYSVKKRNIEYIEEKYSERNINFGTLDFEPSEVLRKLSLFNPRRYKNNVETALPIESSNNFWDYYRELNGLALGSVSGSVIDYIFLNYKRWPKTRVLGISSKTRKTDAIRLLNQQKFELTGCYYNSLLHFECVNYELEILYGKIWPIAIEIKPKTIPGIVKQMAIFQCLDFYDDEGKMHKVDFLKREYFEGKEYLVGIIPHKRIDKLSGRIVVLEALSNEEYQLVDFGITEKIFQKIQKQEEKLKGV